MADETIVIIRDSAYWQNEIDITIQQISELMSGETGTIQVAKTDKDTIQLYSLQEIIRAKKWYLKYCEKQLQKELDKENNVVPKKDYILYLDRECGY